MKTFMRIYNTRTRKLEDTFIHENTPESTFATWISNGQNKFSYDQIKDKTIYYHTSSNSIDEQITGLIRFDKNENRFVFINQQIYFHLNTEGSHWIVKNSNDIFWSDLYNSYFLKSHLVEFRDFEDEEDLIELSEDLDVLNISEEIFLKNKQKFEVYMFEDEKKKNLERHISLKICMFFKKCKNCKKENNLTISNMIEGRFTCQYCKLKN